MIQDGVYEAKITENGAGTTKNGADYLWLRCRVDGYDDPVFAKVWLTPKSMGIARQQLKTLGVDPDLVDLAELADQSNYLSGIKAKIIVEVRDGYVNANLPLPERPGPSKKRLGELSKALRDAKRGDEDDAGPSDDDEIPF